MNELELALRQRMTRYLEGSLQLRELHEWLGSAAWNIDAWASASVAQLYHDVELLFAEHAHGDWTEDELKDRLAPLASYVSVEANQSLLEWATAGNNAGSHALVFTASDTVIHSSLSFRIPAFNPA